MKENNFDTVKNGGNKNSIEEALEKLTTGKKMKMDKLLRAFKREGIENFVITRKKYVDVILSDYKRVLKENEEWKRAYQEEKEQQFNLIKENEKLKAVRKWYFENTVSKICTPEILNKILRNDYISKQKVKDKIEELNKKILDAERFDERILKYRYQKQVLQELIEESIEKLQKENEESKDLIAHKNEYTKKLEKDLFENCSNYVISKQKIKDKIEELKRMKVEGEAFTTAVNFAILILQELLEESEDL